MDSLPKNNYGKILKTELRKTLKEQAPDILNSANQNKRQN
jgi:acyl-coenzyme A synthetase/AMP-(fatty) acid ligase